MFRMGGRSDDGIMSIRRGYAEGDQVKEPGYFDKSGLGMLLKGIGTEARKAGAGVYDLGGVPLNAASRFFLGENPGFYGARFFGLGEEEGVDPNKDMFFTPFCIIFKQLSTPLISKCAVLPESQLFIYVPPYTFNTLSELFMLVS